MAVSRKDKVAIIEAAADGPFASAQKHRSAQARPCLLAFHCAASMSGAAGTACWWAAGRSGPRPTERS